MPASMFVLQHVRGKYACKKCEEGGVATAERSPESQLIEKGLPGPSVVTQVIVSKYVDHLPLYRQESMFRRHGVELARSTMCGWMAEAANLLEPLVKLMSSEMRQSKVINTDDTPVPVQDKGRGKTKTGRMWTYLGDADHPYIVFDYTPTRSRAGPIDWLGDYEGYLQADAYAGYDELYRGGKVIDVGCWAHARRKFHDERNSDAQRSHHVLGMIRQLYAIEKRAKKEELDAGQITALRQEQAKPILDQLHKYLMSERDAVLPQSPMGEAITYALNQWEALVRYTADGDLAIDNNAAENAIRPLAIGRKNYLFMGSDAGGRTAAILYSIIASARRAGIDVWLYLRDLLTRMPSAPMSKLPNFLPNRWHHPALDD
ncbi:MAG: IS66 family transposase [Phycisphaeraceae bacterium]